MNTGQIMMTLLALILLSSPTLRVNSSQLSTQDTMQNEKIWSDDSSYTFDDFDGYSLIVSTMPSAIFNVSCIVNYVAKALIR